MSTCTAGAIAADDSLHAHKQQHKSVKHVVALAPGRSLQRHLRRNVRSLTPVLCLVSETLSTNLRHIKRMKQLTMLSLVTGADSQNIASNGTAARDAAKTSVKLGFPLCQSAATSAKDSVCQEFSLPVDVVSGVSCSFCCITSFRTVRGSPPAPVCSTGCARNNGTIVRVLGVYSLCSLSDGQDIKPTTNRTKINSTTNGRCRVSI